MPTIADDEEDPAQIAGEQTATVTTSAVASPAGTRNVGSTATRTASASKTAAAVTQIAQAASGNPRWWTVANAAMTKNVRRPASLASDAGSVNRHRAAPRPKPVEARAISSLALLVRK